MNASANQIVRSAASGLMPLLLVTTVLALGATRLTAAENPGILPIGSKPHGKSYGEWASGFFQWALSLPADRNPLTDVTGEFNGEGQSGPVWFLAGTFGGSAERYPVVPEGKTLFVPVYNWIFGSGVFDCDPTVPGVPCDVADLKALAAANTDAAVQLEVTIDGVPVPNVRQYRAASIAPFSITYPENSVVGVPAGNYYPQVTDGYWLMLAPLSKGQHTIRLEVEALGTIFGTIQYTVIHHLTIQ